MKRMRATMWLNLAIPGAGLIVLCREWLGATVAVLFGVFAQIAVLGLWVAPLDIPRWIAIGSAVAAAMVWVFAQWLVRARLGQAAAGEATN